MQLYKKRNKIAKRKNKILVNTSYFIFLQLFVILYTIIRVFLMNIYLTSFNFGLLNLVISIAPITLLFMNASQSKSSFIFYKYSLRKDYVTLSSLLNEQISEIRKSAIPTIIEITLLILFSAFLVKSPGLNWYSSSLLILSSTVEFLSYTIIVPYVKWYLNSIYKNYIYDGIMLLFSTILNLISFLIIGLYGNGHIIFNGVTVELSKVYITIIVSMLLSFTAFFTNITLFILRKKFMPWFVRKKGVKIHFFNKSLLGYLYQDSLAFIASFMIPIILYIFTIFIHLATSISGIYYSYLTFARAILMIATIISSLKPYLAKKIIEDDKESIFLLNRLIYSIGLFLILFVVLDVIIVVPYVMVLSNTYFSFWISFLMGINILFYALKSIDENFIFVHGKPEKYFLLTLYEIIIGILALVIGFCVIFYINEFTNNVMNILYCLLICETCLRFSKYCLNIWYLIKKIYKIKFSNYIRQYYKLHLALILFILAILLFLIYSNVASSQNNLFTNDIKISYFSHSNIDILFNDNIHMINWGSLIFFTIFVDVIYFTLVVFYFYMFENNFVQKIKTMIKLKNIH